MSDDKRAEMLQRAMDKLREKYPAESSEWIRAKADSIVSQKLGPARQAAVPSDSKPSNDSGNDAPAGWSLWRSIAPRKRGKPNASAGKQKAKTSASRGFPRNPLPWGHDTLRQLSGALSILCFVVFLVYKFMILVSGNANAINTVGPEIVGLQWLLSAWGFAMLWLLCVISSDIVNAIYRVGEGMSIMKTRDDD